MSASTAARRATWPSGSPTSTGASTASGSSCTGTPTSRLRISGLPRCPASSRKTCERLGILIPAKRTVHAGPLPSWWLAVGCGGGAPKWFYSNPRPGWPGNRPATNSDRQQRITLARSTPTRDMSGLKSGRSFDSAVPPGTWPTHYGPVSPRCPRTAINSQRSPPAATCENEARAGFEPASNAPEHPRNA